MDVTAIATALAHGKHVATSANCTHALVIPPQGGFRRVAQELSFLADDPVDVRYVSSPRAGFRIPIALSHKYSMALQGLGAGE